MLPNKASEDAWFTFELTPPLDTLVRLAALEGVTLQEVIATAFKTVIDGCVNGTRGHTSERNPVGDSPASLSFRAVLASVRAGRTEAVAQPAGISEVQDFTKLYIQLRETLPHMHLQQGVCGTYGNHSRTSP